MTMNGLENKLTLSSFTPTSSLLLSLLLSSQSHSIPFPSLSSTTRSFDDILSKSTTSSNKATTHSQQRFLFWCRQSRRCVEQSRFQKDFDCIVDCRKESVTFPIGSCKETIEDAKDSLSGDSCQPQRTRPLQCSTQEQAKDIPNQWWWWLNQMQSIEAHASRSSLSWVSSFPFFSRHNKSRIFLWL